MGIVSIVALRQGQIRIGQAIMLGSVLSNILLVLGCCFMAAGFRGGGQESNATIASAMSSLMAVSSASLIIPATLWAALSNSDQPIQEDDSRIMLLSRGTSILLLLLYVSYLFFQLKTHHYLCDAEHQQEGEDEEEHILSPWAAGVALLVITVVVAVGSSLQIAFFVAPFLVILGWIIDQPMNLHFKGFETVMFFLSVLVVNYLIQDGKSNWLEGAMCLGMYIIIALAFYVYPDNANDIGTVVKDFFSTRI